MIYVFIDCLYYNTFIWLGGIILIQSKVLEKICVCVCIFQRTKKKSLVYGLDVYCICCVKPIALCSVNYLRNVKIK